MSAGEAAGALTVLAAVPYLYGIVRGGVRPAKVSWLIWTVLGVVSFVSQEAAGATDSLWLTAGQVVLTGTIFVLSLVRGTPGWTRLDVSALVLATLGLLGWQLSTIPAVALLSVIFADAMGVVVTLRKAATDPDSESLTTFAVLAVGSTFGIVAVGSWDPVLLAYPVYLVVHQVLLVVVIAAGRRRPPPHRASGRSLHRPASPRPAGGRHHAGRRGRPVADRDPGEPVTAPVHLRTHRERPAR